MLVQPSAVCTVQAKVLEVLGVVCRCREGTGGLRESCPASLNRLGGSGGCLPPPAQGRLVARGCSSSDLFSCLLLWEASASLKASVPVRGTLERFTRFGGFRALGEEQIGNKPFSQLCRVRTFWRRESQGDFHPPRAPKPPPFLQPSPGLGEQPPLCQAVVAGASAHPGCCSLIRYGVCN